MGAVTGSGRGQLDEAGADGSEPRHVAAVVAGSELVEERGGLQRGGRNATPRLYCRGEANAAE